MNKDQILSIVIDKVNALVETLPGDSKFKVNEATVLFGPNSNIDSLSLVSIIVELETAFSVDHNHDISLSDDRAMMREVSPFATINNLVDYIDELINGK